jgi:hypothetical protein
MTTKKTCNFIEAVNSGKRFRALSGEYTDEWFSVDNSGDLKSQDHHESFWIGKHFVNAQFELEEKTITIKESEFDKAWDNHLVKNDNCPSYVKLKKELGF